MGKRKENILNRPRLLDDLLGYDKDNIDPNIFLSIEKIINHNDFKPDTIKRSSAAAFGLSMWVRAIFKYEKVMKEIRPRQAALAEASGQYNAIPQPKALGKFIVVGVHSNQKCIHKKLVKTIQRVDRPRLPNLDEEHGTSGPDL